MGALINKQPDDLTSVEKHIEEIFSGLRIFKMPVQTAIENACIMFEMLYEDILFGMYHQIEKSMAIQQIRNSIQILIPQILRHCERTGNPNQVLEIVEDDLAIAKEAMNFCSKYSELETCFVRYYKRYYDCDVSGSIVTFRYPPDIDFGRVNLNALLHEYRANKEGFMSFVAGKKPHLSAKALEQLVSQAIELSVGGSVIPFISDEVYNVFKEIMVNSAPKPTLDKNIKCPHYTVRDYYNFWNECCAIAYLNHYICDQRHRRGMSRAALEGRVLHLELTEFADIIASRTKLDRVLLLEILSDLILDMGVKRPDLLVQPLIKLPDDERLVITPSLLSTSNWETCLLRNWIITHPDVYGHMVAQKKELLSNEFGEILRKHKFAVAVRKKIHDRSGQTIGDVDVGVLDIRTNHVILFEVKWIIEPDSIFEKMKADTEIEKGIQQLQRLQAMLEQGKDFYFKQIFPSVHIGYQDVKQLEFYVIGNGSSGSVKSTRGNVRVFDYTITADLLKVKIFDTLAAAIYEVNKMHDTVIETVNKKECCGQFKLGGFVFRFPAFGDPGGQHYLSRNSAQRTDVNAPCVCGSGKKYKKCCKDLENYVETAILSDK